MRTWLIALLVASVSIAGCTDGAPTPPQDSGFSEELDSELEATDTTGVIRGVVIDQTVTPIPGAAVALMNSERTTSSDEDGFFGFDELEPGTYFITVSKPGYGEVQQSVDVVAGVDQPPAVRVQMAADPSSLPYVTENQWSGYFTCSSAAFQVCPAADLVLCIAGSCDVLPDEFLAITVVEEAPTWINAEMVWTSTQPLGSDLDFYLEKVAKDNENDWDHHRSVEGPSPLLLTIDEAEAAGLGYGLTHDIQHRVFPALTPETVLFLEQEFEIFTHKFYNYAPPEGWRFTEDEVPVPPS